MSTQQPVLDKDHPEILEEARWWVNVHVKRNVKERSKVKMVGTSRIAADSQAINGLTSGFASRHQTNASKSLDIARVIAGMKEGEQKVETAGTPAPKKGATKGRKAKAKAKAVAKTPEEPKSWEDTVADAGHSSEGVFVHSWMLPVQHKCF